MKILFVILLCMGFLAGCGENAPVISSIDPRIGRLGDLLTIQGSGFGNERGESYVSIGGIIPTSSSYIYWNESEIIVRIPEFGEAGLVYVHRGRKRSNPALFANTLNIPVMMEAPNSDNDPPID